MVNDFSRFSSPKHHNAIRKYPPNTLVSPHLESLEGYSRSLHHVAQLEQIFVIPIQDDGPNEDQKPSKNLVLLHQHPSLPNLKEFNPLTASRGTVYCLRPVTFSLSPHRQFNPSLSHSPLDGSS